MKAETSHPHGAWQHTQPHAPPTHFLHPGDVALALEGERLETLLGSCVAVILTDPRRTVGAMCHIVHSCQPPAGAHQDTAYASNAMNAMFARLRAVGIEPRLCQAYVFGGGNMFPDVFSTHHVGSGNVAWVLDFLQRSGIKVMDQSVGDPCYRKIGWTVGAPSLDLESIDATHDKQ